MLEGYVKDNFKIYMVSRLQQSLMQRKPNFDVKSTKSMTHEIKVKGMSWTITMQGFKLAAITDAEKTKLRSKNQTST